MSDYEALITNEVETLHAFISAWFRGDLEKSQSVFQPEFADRLAQNMINIQPSGQVLTRADLVSSIYKGYGCNPNFKITIRDCSQWFVSKDKGLIGATYREFQECALNTIPKDNVRISTVLFDAYKSDERPHWLHIHETHIPAAD